MGSAVCNASLSCLFALSLMGAALPQAVHVVPGPVNRVRIGEVAVYADTSSGARYVLFTHARRDAVAAGAEAVKRGAAAIVPAAERELFADAGAFWLAFEKARFHDYAQRSTKVPVEAIPVSRAVRGGDTLELGAARFEVLDTPGYTPGALTYLYRGGGKPVAFTGDLILEGGRLADLYSLQDAVPEAKVRGYHGYAARAAALIASLRKVAAAEPGALVPVRGGVIEDPQAAIAALIRRLQAAMANHFSTDALLWYWGPQSLRLRSAAILDSKPVDSMPMAEQSTLPDWIIPFSNCRLILSQSGAAFLVDAGAKGIREHLEGLRRAGKFSKLEGVWLTHYHDDHTDFAQQVADAFGTPVYATPSMLDILAHPGRYRMPCLTTAPVRARGQADKRRIRWHEYEFTFYDFPGQTLYHGGLHVRRDGGGSVFFAGDSFTPSGLDDYCLQNRNIIREGEGLLRCLSILEGHPEAWVINQHVAPMFHFDQARFTRMKTGLTARMGLLDELSPWPDRNFLLDENWARLYPYAQSVAVGKSFDVALHITNHAPSRQEFHVRWNLPAGVSAAHVAGRLQIPARGEGVAVARLRAGTPGLHVITVDLRFGAADLPQFTEAMVRVQ